MSEKMKKETTPVDDKNERREGSSSVKIRRRNNNGDAADDSAKAEFDATAPKIESSIEKDPKGKLPASSDNSGENTAAKPAPKKAKKENSDKENTSNAKQANTAPQGEKAAKPETKSEIKSEAKSEAKSGAEAKAPKSDKSEAKSGAKPEAKSDAKSGAKSGAKPEAKSGAKADAKQGKPEGKTDAKDENKQKARPPKAQKKIQETSARIISPAKPASDAPANPQEAVTSQPAKTAVAEKPKDSAKNTQSKSDAKPDAKSDSKSDSKSEKNTDKNVESKKVNADSKTADTGSANKEADKEAVKSENKGQKPKDADSKTAPAASATPDSESSKSILPPVGSKATRVDHGEQDGTAPASTSHVRVISRPAPNAARVIEKAPPRPAGEHRAPGGAPGGYRRDGGGAPRPAGGYNREGGAPRPGGYNSGAPRPAGGYNSGAPRPAGGYNNGAPRPAGGYNNGAPRPPHDKDAPPRGPRPLRPAGGPPRVGGDAPLPPLDNDQSRKKRNKGRRTVEFGQTDTQDNFRRRANMPVGAEDDDNFRHRRSRRPKKQQQVPQSTQPMKAAKRKIRFEEAIRVADIAHQMSVKSGEIIKALLNLGIMATINNALDLDTATLIASEFGYEVDKVGFSEDSYLVVTEEESSVENQKPRPPVVTIMGHVDHGKTSLLDAIRKTHVTTGEAGGITQHIGAYHVSTKRGDIVFLDTPGHEAFTAMRARGAQVTDLVVLVVAADDGVMEQTREAINHSKAAGVPILVAVNKIDKEGADSDRVLRELSELGLQAEDWGGDTVVGFVSAKTGQGLDELLELIALQAEILELTANQDKAARGRVVEAKLDKGRGPVATVLIQEGTLRQGDAFVCGVFAGRVRAFFDDQGRKIKEAGPSTPVEIQGFDGVPEAGEEFICLTDEKAARRIAETRAVKQRERELAKQSRVTLETFLASTPSDTEAQVLNLVLKADVQGSLEAITTDLHKLSTDKVRITVIHSGAGAITETDIMLAAASHAIIIGFNVRPTAKVKDVAERELIDIRFYDIIYKLREEIKSAMAGMLAPISREVYLGQAEVRQPFGVPKVGVVAGSMVNDGKIVRNNGVRLLRDGVVVYTGKVSSLRRVKDDVKEVTKGFECGIGLENFNDIKIGDVIECFEMVEEAATL